MDYYSQIKEELINNETYKRVKDFSKNKSDLKTYYNVGKILIEAQGGEERAKYGNKLIKEYSIKLKNELGLKYNETLLKRTRQFYLLIEKSATLWHQSISWSHYRDLLPLKDIDKISYYLDITEKFNLS